MRKTAVGLVLGFMLLMPTVGMAAPAAESGPGPWWGRLIEWTARLIGLENAKTFATANDASKTRGDQTDDDNGVGAQGGTIIDENGRS